MRHDFMGHNSIAMLYNRAMTNEMSQNISRISPLTKDTTAVFSNGSLLTKLGSRYSRIKAKQGNQFSCSKRNCSHPNFKILMVSRSTNIKSTYCKHWLKLTATNWISSCRSRLCSCQMQIHWIAADFFGFHEATKDMIWMENKRF